MGDLTILLVPTAIARWNLLLINGIVQVSDRIQLLGYTDAVSLQYSLYMTCFVCAIGGAFFLGNAVYIEADRKAADHLQGVTGTPYAA